MNDTGERMVPEKTEAGVFWEHVFRYAFACQKVKKRTVLDIASGEGYGTYALSKVAASVIGVDVSAEAVDHAKKKYGLDFRVGSAEQIPVAASSLDAVISFETIEHVPSPKNFVEEAFRVLKPGGLFIVSTPNKDTYRHGYIPNPFHCSELTKSEFTALLTPRFELEALLGQTFPQTSIDRFVEKRFRGRGASFAARAARKMTRLLKGRYLPVSDASDVETRQKTIDSIPTLNPPFSGLWNPYSVRRFASSSNEEPTYLLAVGSRRKT